MGMRALVLAMVAIQVGSAAAARAENSPASDRSISETLTLFDETIRDTAARLTEISVLNCRTRRTSYSAVTRNSTLRPRG